MSGREITVPLITANFRVFPRTMEILKKAKAVTVEVESIFAEGLEISTENLQRSLEGGNRNGGNQDCVG